MDLGVAIPYLELKVTFGCGVGFASGCETLSEKEPIQQQ